VIGNERFMSFFGELSPLQVAARIVGIAPKSVLLELNRELENFAHEPR
jgi:hypothetical protein